MSETTCAFCHLDTAANTVLIQGTDCFVIADYAPMAAAHLLLIPRAHIPNVASLPPELDGEFCAIKRHVQAFVAQNYGPATCWENGGGSWQSVPHAHLHIVSWQPDPAAFRDEGRPFDGLDALRWLHRQSREPYFLIGSSGLARYLPYDIELARSIIRSAGETYTTAGLTRQQRRETGGPTVAELKRRWDAWSGSGEA